MMAKHNLYGKMALVGTFGLVSSYCFMGYSAKMKVISVLLFTGWQQHIFTLGSHLGVYIHLKCNK